MAKEGSGRVIWALVSWGPGSSAQPPILTLGAVIDLTLLADLRLTDPHRFFLTCVSGEPGSGRGLEVWDPPLLLEKDDRIVRTFPPRQPLHSTRNGSRHITLRGFSQPSDLVGVFSCIGGVRRTRVIYVHNSPGGKLELGVQRGATWGVEADSGPTCP